MNSIIKVTKNVHHLGKDYEMIEYFDENVALLDFCNGVEHIYLKSKNQSYSVNHQLQQLSPIDLSLHKTQFEQLKRQLGEITIASDRKTPNSMVYTVEGISNSIVLRGALTSERSEVISKTAYLDYYQYNNQFSMYELPLASDEIITSNDTSMNISGKSVSSKFAVKKIEVEVMSSKLETVSNYDIAEVI